MVQPVAIGKQIGRKIRGFVRSCDDCGKKRQALLVTRSFSGGKEKKNYVCKQCYSKMMKGKKLKYF